MDLPDDVIHQFREVGRKGGRPRTIQHVETGFCRCVECRRKNQPTKSESKEKRIERPVAPILPPPQDPAEMAERDRIPSPRTKLDKIVEALPKVMPVPKQEAIDWHAEEAAKPAKKVKPLSVLKKAALEGREGRNLVNPDVWGTDYE